MTRTSCSVVEKADDDTVAARERQDLLAPSNHERSLLTPHTRGRKLEAGSNRIRKSEERRELEARCAAQGQQGALRHLPENILVRAVCERLLATLVLLRERQVLREESGWGEALRGSEGELRRVLAATALREVPQLEPSVFAENAARTARHPAYHEAATWMDAMFCDLVPHTCLNPSQKKVLDREYVPRAAKLGLPAVNLPPVPKTFADDKRREEVLRELEESRAKQVVLPGDEPIGHWLAKFDSRRQTLGEIRRHR